VLFRLLQPKPSLKFPISFFNDADPYRGCGTTYLHTYNPDQTWDPVNSNPSGAIVEPISLATTFQQSVPGVPVHPDDPNSFGKGYEYSRTGNPTRGAFERAMAAAEHATYAVAFASGSSATSAVIHATLQSGEHVLCVDDVYGGTQRYFRKIVTPTMGISIDFCDMTDPLSLPWKTDLPTKLVWLESPTNPTLKLTDIRGMADAMRAKHPTCILAVDNTFCSPYFQSPLDLGADLVVHSVTKYVVLMFCQYFGVSRFSHLCIVRKRYIGGHSDVVMGVVCTNSSDLYDKLRFVQNGVGAVPSPFDCYLAHRGLKTLHLRMEASARYVSLVHP
jgi:cystathionine gamma-lyase